MSCPPILWPPHEALRGGRARTTKSEKDRANNKDNKKRREVASQGKKRWHANIVSELSQLYAYVNVDLFIHIMNDTLRGWCCQ